MSRKTGKAFVWGRRWTIAGAMFSLSPATIMAAEAGELAMMNTPDLTATCLLVAGIVFLILEIKIVSFGILGLLGTASMVLSGLVIWLEGEGTFWGLPLAYYIPILVLIMLPLVALGFLGAQAYKQKVASGSEGFVGELAKTSEALEPQGRVFFQGTYWQAVSSVAVPAGAVVRVTGVDRLTLFVEPVEEDMRGNSS